MATTPHPLPSLVMCAALASVVVLQKRGLAFAFCGEIASYFYGEATNPPWVIELMLLSPPSINITGLKQSIATTDPNHFIYLPSSNSLRYRDPRSPTQLPCILVIEITVSSTPRPTQCIQTVNGFPIVPFSFLLLQKLREWDRVKTIINQYLSQDMVPLDPAAPRSMKETEQTLARELLSMLRTFRTRDLCHVVNFDPELHTSSNERATRFFAAHSVYRNEWRRIGFLKPEKGTAPIGQGVQTNAPSASGQVDLRNPHNGQPMLDLAGSARPQADSSKHRTTTTAIPRERTLKTTSASLSPANKQSRAEPLNVTSSQAGPSNNIPPTTISPQKSNPKHTQAPPAITENSTPANPTMTSPKTNAKKKEKPARIPFVQLRRLAAHTTVSILRSNGFECAIFGSMACKLYGGQRIPNDVDILVLPPPSQPDVTQEDIKDLIVAQNPSQFILKAAKDPEATYRVLYFHVSAKLADSAASTSTTTVSTPPPRSQSSKVDILLPGIMHLPSLSPAQITWKAQLPLVPYDILVLQKLQGWDDHRNAEEERYKKKAGVDVDDLEWILDVGISRHMRRGRNRVGERWSDRELFTEEFEMLSRARVKAFCAEFPEFVQAWTALGFETGDS